MDCTALLKKDILNALPESDGQKLAFLCAVTKSRGGIDVYKKSTSLTYEFDDKDEALAVLDMVKEQVEGDVFFIQKGSQDNLTFCVQLKDKVASDLLKQLNLSRYEQDGFVIDNGVDYILSLKESEDFFAFFKGVVLTSGQLRFPDENYSNYSMQIKLSNERYGEAIRQKMTDFGIDLKMSETKTNYILQSRNSQEIEDMLAMCSASECVFKLNNVIAERDKSNEFNRQSNLYMANLARAVTGASKYINAIEFLTQNGVLQQQEKKLRDVAKARIEYEDDSMRELAEKLSMSKTSLSRYLNRLLELAEEENGRK
ncbi:MAG: DNA-binding protein WhiA [Clostridiales bacterium]|nr:DNA-binding protein WhiA [Clostridiales bacterium]